VASVCRRCGSLRLQGVEHRLFAETEHAADLSLLGVEGDLAVLRRVGRQVEPAGTAASTALRKRINS